MQTWILTFNRPNALNRQIDSFKFWTDVHVFSNHPNVQLTQENHELWQQGKLNIIYNTLSDEESNSCTNAFASLINAIL